MKWKFCILTKILFNERWVGHRENYIACNFSLFSLFSLFQKSKCFSHPILQGQSVYWGKIKASCVIFLLIDDKNKAGQTDYNLIATNHTWRELLKLLQPLLSQSILKSPILHINSILLDLAILLACSRNHSFLNQLSCPTVAPAGGFSDAMASPGYKGQNVSAWGFGERRGAGLVIDIGCVKPPKT